MPSPQPLLEIQPWIAQLFSLVSDTLVGIAALIGIAGLWQWRKEMVGKKKFDLACRVIHLALRFQTQVRSIRENHLLIDPSERRPRPEDEERRISPVLDQQFVVVNRIQLAQKTLAELSEAGWEADAIFQSGECEPIIEMGILFRQLKTAVAAIFEADLALVKYGDDSILDPDNAREMRKIAQIGADEGDEFYSRFHAQVERLKSNLKKYV